ncbi:hypothetical protein DMC14_000895 [Metamycoplasma phocicerebrale]|uniref:Uncharacterized protein n=1 Tax=Metamycoplasma phocicerebrale TaxID=142649 RepID=A0A3T0TTF5_9BACT|nr:hypothetical protein [Metamycoplasma phocicerebrale]AZZ65350.1 hypothetical protein DMC14_000895 [Metamycoplasma phocicerebrale]
MKKQNKKEELKYTKSKIVRELDWDKIFTDQVHTIYEPLVAKIKPALDKVYKKIVLDEHAEEIKFIDENVTKIQNLHSEIKVEKKTKKITAKKVCNGFILFFSFLLIGLPFLGFYRKNRKAIKDFKEYSKIRLDEISKLIVNNNIILTPIYNKFSILEWKNMLLKEMEINKVNNIEVSEIAFYLLSPTFYSFYSVNKYDIRNSYYYDILFGVEVWQNIVTSATVYKQIKTKDGWTSIPITAYHSEPTPFITTKHSVNIPTNYLPELTFNPNSERLNQKQYNHKLKKGEFLLENPEFYQYFNFDFNDKIKFTTYFQLKTQENFIDFAKYFDNDTYALRKYKKNLYTTRVYNENRLSYSNVHNWLQLLVDLKQPINSDHIYNVIYNIMTSTLKPIFKSITQAYLNKNIASEDLNTQGYYLSTYKDDKKYIQTNKIGLFEIFNKAVMGFKYKLESFNPARKPSFEIKEILEDNFGEGTVAMRIQMSSYWEENLIDSVYKSGVIINVPFVRYNSFNEQKWVIYSPKYKTKNDGSFVSFNDTQYEKSVLNFLKYGFDNNFTNFSYNTVAANNKEELEFNISLIKKIVDGNDKNSNNIKVLIDNQGLFIFINKKINSKEIEKIFNLL